MHGPGPSQSGIASSTQMRKLRATTSPPKMGKDNLFNRLSSTPPPPRYDKIIISDNSTMCVHSKSIKLGPFTVVSRSAKCDKPTTGRLPYQTTTKSTLTCFHSIQKGPGLELGWRGLSNLCRDAGMDTGTM